MAIPYLTTRQRQADGNGAAAYDGRRGAPHGGRCTVELRPIPMLQAIPEQLPFYMPRVSETVGAAEALDEAAFWNEIQVGAGSTTTGSVVVFVHGYANDFEKNCRMAARLQLSLTGAAQVVLFSWPSSGSPTRYVEDVANLEWSVPQLAYTIAELGRLLGPSKVQLLAHSLGSRGAIFALDRLGCERRTRPLIERLVLVAADFDSALFRATLPRLRPLAKQITLYASSYDTPLSVSRRLSGSPRLGEAGDYLTLAEGVETIDVSSVGRYEPLGHEYYSYHPAAAADLTELLTRGTAAADRPLLRARTRRGLVYWTLGDTRREEPPSENQPRESPTGSIGHRTQPPL